MIRQDLFGCIDIVAAKPGHPLLAVQSTSGPNAPARVTKIQAEPKAKVWLATGAKFVVHGWAKRGPRGGRKVWTCRTIGLHLSGGDIHPVDE